MILAKLGEATKDDFSVLDGNNSLVSSIPVGEFSAHLFDPSGAEGNHSSVVFTELGHGHYRASFVPNVTGTWMFVVYHPVLFPWGKSNTVQVFGNDFDSIAVMLEKVLGLVQENFSVDQTEYDENNNMTQSRVRIYSDSISVGTDNNVIASYQMIATYNGVNMESYNMVKI